MYIPSSNSVWHWPSFGGKESELGHRPSGVPHWNHSQVQCKLPPHTQWQLRAVCAWESWWLRAPRWNQNVGWELGVFQISEDSMRV